jgi:abequosyltransferase
MLLSIIVPTYNRASHLKCLLTRLQAETECVAPGLIEVLVIDNCSSDSTPEVAQSFQNWQQLNSIRNAENLGADGNFCVGVGGARGDYFWILGDDDLPKIGLIEKLLELLRSEKPDLAFFRSDWSNSVPQASRVPASLPYRILPKGVFIVLTNVWLTFISGVVIKRSSSERFDTERLKGTSLVQLAWITSALVDGERFLYIAEPCVDALAGNTGGYNVIETFASNLPTIFKETLPPDLYQNVIDRLNWTYLPLLLFNLRKGAIGVFLDSQQTLLFHESVRSSFSYRLLLKPLTHRPMYIVQLFGLVGKIVARIFSVKDRIALLSYPIKSV